MIRHTVVFKLIYPGNSPETIDFFNAATKLAAIPGVNNFECLRQTSKKNAFDYALSMEFDTAKAYEGYNHHTDHVDFVNTYWKRDVINFLEIDYESLV